MGNLGAIGLMLIAMACFAIGDAAVKLSTDHIGVGAVILVMSLVGMLTFSALAALRRQSLRSPLMWHPLILLRCGIEAATAICMVSALAISPLALVISIVQAVPLLVTMGAAFVLKEKIGPRRWIAVCLGLCGVMLMLRPDETGGLLGATLSLLAAMGLASRDIVTRLVPKTVSTLQMANWGVLALLPVALLMLPLTGGLAGTSGSAMWILVIGALVNAVGYLAITGAMRIGEVSAVTPFRYTRLVFSLAISVFFLAERPDMWTLVGVVIVIASGLFILLRERALAHSTP